MIELAQNLAACGVPVFPCWDNKQPALKGGFHEASVAASDYWPSDIIGVPVPPGVLIIDVDAYKGVTTDAIDSVLGCKLDWVTSLIQHTPSGGSHHAFHVAQPLRQGTDLFVDVIGKGFDTRVNGRGYICTGKPYLQCGSFGVMMLASPSVLPQLPAEALVALSVQTDTQHETKPLPDGDRNASEVSKMLDSLDADCSREEWLRVALALKHQYHDDDNTGWALFDNWSMTGSEQYDPIESRKLWTTIKPSRPDGQPTVTLGSLVHIALNNGYMPGMSASEVFGESSAVSVPLSTVEGLVATINERGGAPENIDELTTTIRTLACSDIQRAALTATLQRVLRNHDVKITEADLKRATSPKTNVVATTQIPQSEGVAFANIVVSPVQSLGNVHIQNAVTLREAIFTDRLVRVGSEPYWWNGRHWEGVRKADLMAKIAQSFIGSDYGKDGNVNGTRNQLLNVLPSVEGLGKPDTRVYFKNGVYDCTRPELGVQPHAKHNLNTSTLSVDFDTTRECPNWRKFLDDCFSEEPERITLLQEVMGWWLISDNLNHQKAVAFDGVPRSGKGTIMQVASAILGDAIADISIAQLADNKSLSGLRTAMLGVDRDAKRPPQRDAATVHSQFNKITANEPISIPLLFTQDPWKGSLNCKLAIACNGIPVMVDDSGAAPSRWVVLKFTQQFLGREDLTLGRRLVAEKTAIASWAVNGLLRLMNAGAFTLPQSSIEESHALMDGSSPLMEFAEECLELGDEYSSHGGLLWETYKQWCTVTNNRLGNRTQFLRSLERALQSKGVRYKKSVRCGTSVRTGLSGVQLRSVVPAGNIKAFREAAP